MSLLVLMAPARERVESNAGGGARPAAVSSAREWTYLLSRDGQTVDAEGRCPAAELPRADRVVMVLQDDDVSWLHGRVPPVRGPRLRQALEGLFEESLLGETGTTHLAVGRQGVGQDGRTWVAATDAAWAGALIESMTSQGVEVDALVALAEPQQALEAHGLMAASGQVEVLTSGPDGVVRWPLSTPRLVARLGTARWTAEPAAAAALRDRLQLNAELERPAQRALRAAQQGTNLLQFGLTPRTRASRRWRRAWSTLRSREWRGLHLGLAALLLVNGLGWVLAAWQLPSDADALDRRSAELLQARFPRVTVVVDPVLQMEREVQALRDRRGLSSPTAPETWLDLLASAPASLRPVIKRVRGDAQGMMIESTLTSWPEPVVRLLQEHAQRHQWTVEIDGAVLRITPRRTPSAAASVGVGSGNGS